MLTTTLRVDALIACQTAYHSALQFVPWSSRHYYIIDYALQQQAWLPVRRKLQAVVDCSVVSRRPARQ